MSEWTHASMPPEKTGAYLVRCVNPDDPSQGWLALAYRARGLTQWIEMYRGGLCNILPEGAVTFWQPAPSAPMQRAVGEALEGKNQTGGREHMKLRTTYDDTCPYCGQEINDLWDYDWGYSNHIEVTCPHCHQEIAVTAEVYYIISLIEGADDTISEQQQVAPRAGLPPSGPASRPASQPVGKIFGSAGD